MSVKIGDRVMIGPGTVYWLSEETPETCHPGVALGLYAATVQQHELYPWHDALPAVARWLAERPDDLRVIVRALNIADDERPFQEDWEVVRDIVSRFIAPDTT